LWNECASLSHEELHRELQDSCAKGTDGTTKPSCLVDLPPLKLPSVKLNRGVE
jgi:hypothetical protein